MAQNPVQGKSPKNKEKKEYQFYNEEKKIWQNCRWAWFITNRRNGTKTRYRLPGSKTWVTMPQQFEDKRADNKPKAGPGRQYKYGEAMTLMSVPVSLVANLQKKMEKMEKEATKKRLT